MTAFHSGERTVNRLSDVLATVAQEQKCICNIENLGIQWDCKEFLWWIWNRKFKTTNNLSWTRIHFSELVNILEDFKLNLHCLKQFWKKNNKLFHTTISLIPLFIWSILLKRKLCLARLLYVYYKRVLCFLNRTKMNFGIVFQEIRETVISWLIQAQYVDASTSLSSGPRDHSYSAAYHRLHGKLGSHRQNNIKPNNSCNKSGMNESQAGVD